MLSALLIALMQAGASASAPGAQPSAIVEPDWQRRPTAEDVSRYYPKAARDSDLAGRAVLVCTVTAEGSLTECSAEAVTPEGGGFGEAAVAMSAVFRMRPQTRDGRAVAGGTVRIPVNFIAPANLRTSAVRARHPEVVNEIVELDCRFRGQRVDNCFVRGGGTAKAKEVALKVADEIVLPPLPTRRQQGRIVLPLVFTDASGVFVPPDFITQPRWRARPTPTDVFRAYPEAARNSGVVGNVIIDCKIEARGALDQCSVFQEGPIGKGFGAAALTLTAGFRMDEVDAYGLKVEGRRIRVPLRLSPAKPPTN